MTVPVSILAAGVTCPAGKNFATVVEAYASGERFIEKDRNLVMADGHAPTLAPVYPLTQERDFAERLRKLLTSAHEDCLAQMAQHEEGVAHYAMFLLLPFWMEGGPIVDDFKAKLKNNPLPKVKSLALLFGGHAESLQLIGRDGPSAVREIGETVLVAVVDSLIHSNLLDSLAFHGELLTQDNPYGMIPGEGAAVFALGEENDLAIGRIARLSMMEEPESIADPERGLMGRALANCYGSLLEGGFTPDRFIIDLNGDRARAEEFGFAIASNAPQMTDLAERAEVPTLQLGDLGAASGFVMTALALAAAPRPHDASAEGAIEARYSLLSSSSRHGLRAGAIVENLRNVTETIRIEA